MTPADGHFHKPASFPGQEMLDCFLGSGKLPLDVAPSTDNFVVPLHFVVGIKAHAGFRAFHEGSFPIVMFAESFGTL